MKISLFSNIRNIEVDENEYAKIFTVEENFDFLKNFKNDILNTNLVCKCCKREIRESLVTGIVSCPRCYESILEYLEKNQKKGTLYNSKFLEKFLVLKELKYKGRRPDYSREYYSLKTKIFELKKELKISIDSEDYKKCIVIKETIDDFNKKLLKLRRKING